MLLATDDACFKAKNPNITSSIVINHKAICNTYSVCVLKRYGLNRKNDTRGICINMVSIRNPANSGT